MKSYKNVQTIMAKYNTIALFEAFLTLFWYEGSCWDLNGNLIFSKANVILKLLFSLESRVYTADDIEKQIIRNKSLK